MRIAILGCGSIGLSAALAATLGGKHDIVLVDSVDDVSPSTADILICDDDIAYRAVSEMPLLDCCVELPTIDTSFRGGSRGKGGKIKYRRG